MARRRHLLANTKRDRQLYARWLAGIAVNFASNKKLRLVSKNTSHEFSGRSTGAGPLSTWTHYLKPFEFPPEYNQGRYHNAAARVDSGLEAWELYASMDKYNMDIVVPGGSTVGVYGGWFLGSGYSVLASAYGLKSDQALSLQIITVDERFVTANPSTITDLFYALRSGGPDSYFECRDIRHRVLGLRQGVAESIVTFVGGNVTVPNVVNNPSSATLGANSSVSMPVVVKDLDNFWRRVDMAYAFRKDVPDIFQFLRPLVDSLNAMGIAVNNTTPTSSSSWGSSRHGEGGSPGNASRLFPRSNWGNDTLFNNTMASIRQVVEARYTFRGISMKPTEHVAQIKKKTDPWGLFWAPTTVGSEVWEVITADGLPTQNGPPCGAQSA
ncbi:hypothetical protein BGZ57DRAFT_987025 [Hyaloscypha finlandica]|nr:hypothetical protein BGZ57DRAFT_987025 [Hyaloscypha finlandica]